MAGLEQKSADFGPGLPPPPLLLYLPRYGQHEVLSHPGRCSVGWHSSQLWSSLISLRLEGWPGVSFQSANEPAAIVFCNFLISPKCEFSSRGHCCRQNTLHSQRDAWKPGETDGAPGVQALTLHLRGVWRLWLETRINRIISISFWCTYSQGCQRALALSRLLGALSCSRVSSVHQAGSHRDLLLWAVHSQHRGWQAKGNYQWTASAHTK